MSKSAEENSEQGDDGRSGGGSRRKFLRSVISAPLAAGLGSGLGWSDALMPPGGGRCRMAPPQRQARARPYNSRCRALSATTGNASPSRIETRFSTAPASIIPAVRARYGATD